MISIRILKFSNKFHLYRYESTFISSHFIVNKQELNEIIKGMKSPTRQREDGQIEIQICNLCSKQNKNNPDNTWKLLVRPNGSYHCYRCSCSGSWFDLKQKVKIHSTSGFSRLQLKDSELYSSHDDDEEGYNHDQKKRTLKSKQPIPDQIESFSYTQNLFPSDSTQRSSDAIQVLEYLTTVRKLSEDILMRYGVGYCLQKFIDDDGEWREKLCVTFPWIMHNDPTTHSTDTEVS
jgi:hypothetical protein